VRDEEIAGRYRLIEPLGRGAMSSVWLAEDRELGRRVAVKLLSPAANRVRFAREARAAAALAHPNLCAVYDYGESGGTPYMVLEYLPRGSLEERLQTGVPLPDAEAFRITAEMAAGLAHAHGRGLVHRDLKPANVLFDGEGRAKIADFGIARVGGGGTLTEAGTVLGTASYISPEAADGRPAGPASDVYSLGVIVFRMLTGRLPFVGTNAMDVVRMHRDEPPPSIRDLRADPPARLAALATAALAKNPADRPADGSAVVRALRRDREDATTILVPTATAATAALERAAETGATQVLRPPRGTSRGSRRRRAGLVGALAALALLGAGVAVALVAIGRNGGAAPTTLPALVLPTVGAASSSSSNAEPTTTAATTSASTPTTATTAETTTAQATAPATTAPATPTLPPVTTAVVPPPVPLTTALPTTSAATTTGTTATTTATLPGTTTTPGP
jgi:serine/threonine-protein kinase